MNTGIDHKTTIPLKWFFSSVVFAISTLFTMFYVGGWVSNVEAKVREHESQIIEVKTRVEGNDAVMQRIDKRLFRIEIVTGADKIKKEE